MQNGQILETAIRYGVALPETGELLRKDANFVELDEDNDYGADFHPTTFFYWLRIKEGKKSQMIDREWCLYTSFEREQLYSGFFGGDVECVPAPQMHEIAKMLPETIKQDGKKHDLTALMHEGLCYQSRVISESELFLTYIQNHHFAQAHAELYLKLREAGLLGKEVKSV